MSALGGMKKALISLIYSHKPKVEEPKPHLFNWGKFISHSGKELNYKIDCDALTDQDLDCLAQLVNSKLPCGFKTVIGVPRGGLRFAKALTPYCREGGYYHLVCDDVLTTGKSMRRTMDKLKLSPTIGIVIFSRTKDEGYHPGILTCFSLTS